MPGLAHFCEHLLFMVLNGRSKEESISSNHILQQGTEQFPKENEYSEVHHFTDSQARLMPFAVSFQKQRFFECIYGVFKYQLLFQCRNVCLSWRS
jgi:hypothetical protein